MARTRASIRSFSQRFEHPLVCRSRGELVAIDETAERHRLPAHRVDHVPVVDDVAALVVRRRLAAPQCGHRRGAEKAFKPVVEDARTRMMADQPRWHGIEHAPQDEAARSPRRDPRRTIASSDSSYERVPSGGKVTLLGQKAILRVGVDQAGRRRTARRGVRGRTDTSRVSTPGSETNS